MRVNTNILEAQGARLIKQFQTKLLTRGVSFHKRSRFPSSEVFNPSPHNLKREQRHSEQTFFYVCDGKGMWEKQRRNHGLGFGSLPKDLLGLAGTPLAGNSVGRQPSSVERQWSEGEESWRLPHCILTWPDA